jgi:hypothetical protein
MAVRIIWEGKKEHKKNSAPDCSDESGGRVFLWFQSYAEVFQE